MGTAALVAGVFAQIDELLNVEMPGFKVGAHGTLAFATLVDGYGGVISDFQERHDTL